MKPGDHVIPLYTPECGECEYCLSGKTNLCQKMRVTQGKGVMPDGTSRFSFKGKTAVPLHGHQHLLRIHRAARNLAREDRPQAPLEKVCLLGCGITTGVGAVLNTAKVQPGARWRCSAWAASALRWSRARVMAKAGAHHRDRHQPVEVRRWREAHGRHRLRQSEGLRQADPAGDRRA